MAQAGDCWLALNGRGAKNGRAPEHAYGVLDELPNRAAKKCWEQTSPDGTMHVMEGRYTLETGAFFQLRITEKDDGAEGSHKKLKGEGKVELIGNRPIPYSPSTKDQGVFWIELKKKARNIHIENFHIARVGPGILGEGSNDNLIFRNLRFEDTRQNIHLTGHPLCPSINNCPRDKTSKNILLEKIYGIRYSKRHIRLSQGISDTKVVDSHADSQFLDGDFAVGFDVENPGWNIEFRDSSSRGNLYSESEYWNGDGFKAEDQTQNIRWIGCSAFDNADAGFDIKTENAFLQDTVAQHNSRNIRIWKNAVLKNINASFSKTHGGMASQAGIWSVGPYECHHCTLQNNQIQVHGENPGRGFEIKFFDSMISLDRTREGEVEIKRLEEAIKIDWVRTEVWRDGVKAR